MTSKAELRLTNQQKAKILQANFDEVFSLVGECRVCLTKSQIAWILSQVDYASWPTRWFASGGQIDVSKIAEFHADLILRLIGDCQDCEDGMYLLRQNADDPCRLEQSTDGGLTWELAFDYNLCMTAQRIEETLNPPETRYNEETAHIQILANDGETWVDVPDGRDTTPLSPNPYPDDTACWNAANVVEAIKEIIENSGDNIVEITTGIISLLSSVLIALPAAWIISLVVGGVVLAGVLVARSQMDETAYDKLRKILYCSHDIEGGWSQTAFFSVISQCAAEFPFPASVFVTGILQLLGAQGLSNAGHLHLIESVDCTGIDCETCGFITDQYEGNWERWTVLNQSVGVDWGTATFHYEHDTVKMWGGGYGYSPARVLSAVTEFEEPCSVDQVYAYNLGTPQSNRMVIAYRIGGAWTVALNEVAPSHNGGTPWVADIYQTVDAIAIQYSDPYAEVRTINITG